MSKDKSKRKFDDLGICITSDPKEVSTKTILIYMIIILIIFRTRGAKSLFPSNAGGCI